MKLKDYKGTIILTSIIILLPILIGLYLWPQLPDQIATHFDANNQPNGYSSKEFTVFGLPLFMLFVHLMCLAATKADPKSENIHSNCYCVDADPQIGTTHQFYIFHSTRFCKSIGQIV